MMVVSPHEPAWARMGPHGPAWAKIELHTSLNYKPHYLTMSYASVASTPVNSYDVNDVVTLLKTVTTPTDDITRLMELLRQDMEIPQGGVNFRNGTRNFGQAQQPSGAWRGRFSQQGGSAPSLPTSSAPISSRSSAGRYHSRFNSGDKNLNDKILHTVIGNKLNSFTPLTYSDTRDFIYQIMDSGETEFIKDFIEKVFAKATLEELYCGLFAKLIAEIAHKYPVMYEKMAQYHEEFLEIFDDIQSGTCSEEDYAAVLKKKQYRMGYGHFISELAGQNALEKKQLFAMVGKVMDRIWTLSQEDDKVKSVEELIDCIVRLTKSLSEKSLIFFRSVKGDLVQLITHKTTALISREGGVFTSLSNKGRFGMMDLRDLLV